MNEETTSTTEQAIDQNNTAPNDPAHVAPDTEASPSEGSTEPSAPDAEQTVDSTMPPHGSFQFKGWSPTDNAHVAPGAELFDLGDDDADPRQQPAEPTAGEGVFSLEHARKLPEVEFHADNVPFASDNPLHLTKFGTEDGLRLMQVVHVVDGLAAQQIES